MAPRNAADELGPLAVVALLERDELHAAPRELGQELVEQAGLLVHLPVGALGDLGEHVLDRQLAGAGAAARASARVLEQAGDAHHVELVEVGREDREEAEPLEQRHLLVARELEHAPVELDPRQLAVQQARLLVRRRAPRARCTGAARHQAAFAIRRRARGRRSERSSPLGRSMIATPPLASETLAPASSRTSVEKSGS